MAAPLLFGIFLLFSHTASAEDFDLVLEAEGPTYTQAGASISYQFKVINSTGNAISNVKVWNDIPNHVTYVSGGEFFNESPKYVLFTIPTLAAHASVNLTWVGTVDAGLAADTIISNSSFGFTDLADGTTTGFGPGASSRVDVIGTLESVYKDVNGVAFDVKVDSFGFQNFVHNSVPGRNFKNDLLPEDLAMLFGPDVYDSVDANGKGNLTGPAQRWLTAQIADMNLGVCEGMAAASLRLFNWDTFKNYTSPESIQSGANTAVDLNFPGEVIENYVCYYYNTQYANEVYDSQIYGTANETIATLKAGWGADTPVPYTMSIFIVDAKGKVSGGHAITPYGIEKVSASETRILVYDNNYPKQRQYITVNTTADSWRYVTAATPGQGDSIYAGSGSTNKLGLTPNNIRDNAPGVYFKAPFGHSTSSAVAAANSGSPSVLSVSEVKEVVISYAGEGAYIVFNDAGQATGYKSDTGEFVNEIPGATVTYHRGGLGLNVPPRITIPFDGPDDAYYYVVVHAETEGNVTSGDLHITGPGFSVGANDIALDPGDEFEFSFSPHGDHISFHATEDLEAPELVIAYDPITPNDPSIIFDIQGVVLLAEEMVMIELDPELEYVYFDHTGPEAENFDVDIRYSWPDGDVFEHDQLVYLPAGTESAYIDFGAWDGLLEPALFIDDVLQNPSVNHRLKQVESATSYDPTPQEGAPAGVYRFTGTFQNVTEVSFSDVYFTVSNLRDGDQLLNEGANSSDGFVPVPDSLLGEDGILGMNESFTFTFEVAVSSPSFPGITVDVNGVPYDWSYPDTELSYDANDVSFVFGTQESQPSKLINISSRGRVGLGNDVLIGGFVILGTENMDVLVRGVGQELEGIGNLTAGELVGDPFITLVGNGVNATNDDWEDDNVDAKMQAMVDVGALALETGSKSSAILMNLAPGLYTVIFSTSGGEGIGLVEAYEVP